MLRIVFSLAAALVLATALAAPARAASESLSCQTINGQTVCSRGSGATATSRLNCRTVKDRTVCTGSSGLRCETVAGRLACRGVDQRRALQPPPPALPRADEEEDEPLALSTLPQLAAFKGQSAAAAMRALGAPERVRLLANGARVLVWDRRELRIRGGHVFAQPGCQLQLAVARTGLIADGLLTGHPTACPRRLGLG